MKKINQLNSIYYKEKNYAENKKTTKPIPKKIKRMRPRGIKPMKQDEFLETMGRLNLIDEEIKKEKELFEIKIKSLRLEKEYLKSRFKERKNYE